MEDRRKLVVTLMGNLQKNGFGTDIVLECSNGTVKAHKIMLTTLSPYFSGMFSNKMAEAVTGTVDFKIFPVSAVETLISFIYGNLNGETFHVPSIEKLLALAHLTDTKDLFQMVWTYVVRHVKSTTLSRLCECAVLYDEMNSVFDVIISKHAEMKTNNYELIMCLTAGQLDDFLDHAAINKATESFAPLVHAWANTDARVEHAKEALESYLDNVIDYWNDSSLRV